MGKKIEEKKIQVESIKEAESLAKQDNNQKDELKFNKLSFDLDETIELQIVKKLFSSRRKSKKQILKEYEEEMRRRNVKRFDPPLNKGLTNEQVAERINENLINKVPNKYTKSILFIIFSNVFTYFNVLMICIAIVLAFAKASLFDFFFLGIVFLNILVGIIQEIRSKVTIDRLRLITSPKCKVVRNGRKIEMLQSLIVLDDIIMIKQGDQLGVDTIVKEGEVEVDESPLTGESLPIKKKVGDLLLSGSFVVAGSCIGKVEKVGKDTFSGKLQQEAKTYKKNTSILRRSINAFITIISIVLLPITGLMIYTNYANGIKSNLSGFELFQYIAQKTSASAIGMIPSGLVLLVSAALCVGVIQLSKRHTSVQDLYSIERLSRVTTLCLDKTGTLTDGTMKVEEIKQLDSSIDLSILMGSYLHAFEANNATSQALINHFRTNSTLIPKVKLPFSSARKYSAITFMDGHSYALGAPEYVFNKSDLEVEKFVEKETGNGNRVIALVEIEKIENDKIVNPLKVVCLVSLIDHIRDEAYSTIKWFKENDVKIKIISGDNPVTVYNIANKCGVEGADKYISLEGMSLEKVSSIANQYTVFGRVTPDQKAALVKALKNDGEIVAMTGDGVNDILAMKQADCSIAMNNGTDATKAVAHLVLLDSNFASMPEVVKEGRRVINNIQLSASLYIMKTIFTMLLTISVIIFGLASKTIPFGYPFTPKNMIVLEVCIIGMPSFFLALQPNNKLIKGNFMKNVLKNAAPAGFCMFIAVFAAMLAKGILYTKGIIIDYGYNPNALANGIDEFSLASSNLEILVLTTIGLVPLLLLCLPFNKFRAILFSCSFIASFVILLFFPYSMLKLDILNQMTFLGWMAYLGIILIDIPLYLLIMFLIRIDDFKGKVNKNKLKNNS